MDGAINHGVKQNKPDSDIDVLSYMCNADLILIMYVGHGNRRATVVGERSEESAKERIMSW